MIELVQPLFHYFSCPFVLGGFLAPRKLEGQAEQLGCSQHTRTHAGRCRQAHRQAQTQPSCTDANRCTRTDRCTETTGGSDVLRVINLFPKRRDSKYVSVWLGRHQTRHEHGTHNTRTRRQPTDTSKRHRHLEYSRRLVRKDALKYRDVKVMRNVCWCSV